MITPQNNKIHFTMFGETLVVEAWGKDALRVRATKLREFCADDWALLPAKPGDVKISVAGKTQSGNTLSQAESAVAGADDWSLVGASAEAKGGAVIANGKIRCHVGDEGELTFYGKNGEILTGETKNRGVFNNARVLRANGTADFALTYRMTADDDEKFFGMGQYQHGYLNLKGLELELMQRNTQTSVPFMISSKGYGFLWNNPAVGRVTFAKNMTVWRADTTQQLDFWITAGDTPAEIEENYAAAAGTVPMMPDFGTGYWQCKMRYKSQDELMEVAREHKRRGLPMSLIVIDWFHWTERGDFRFNTKDWYDIPAMAAELKDMGVELMVSIWPSIDMKSENYQEMIKLGYCVFPHRGVNLSAGTVLHYDATNPDARKYVWGKVKKGYFDQGIHNFWLDAVEPTIVNQDFDNYRLMAGSGMQLMNMYPMLCERTIYEGTQAEGVTTPLLARSAWAGSQRYGALVWSGDIHSTFDVFRRQVAAGLNMAIAGIPWWTTDIGGFFTHNTRDPEFRELLVRWFQYGTYCPVMRAHGSRNETLDDGSRIEMSGNEVWSFGEEVYEILKKYLFIREGMRPYIKEQMKAAHDKGTPIMRPLLYDFPGDENCWEISDQYMFGPDLLVAPVLSAGVTQRQVYLPAGQDWREQHTGKTYKGGQTVSAAAPIEVIPVFERK